MVEVYGIRLIEKETFLSKKTSWLRLLDISKQDKIQRFISEVDAQRSLLGEILIRSTLCDKLFATNKSLIFDYNEHSKPFIRDREIHFNISHSGEWVVCAISKCEIGVDVERHRKVKLDIARRYFSNEEISDLKQLNEKQKEDYFFTLWTIKESYLKLLGRGLTKGLNTFTVRKSGEAFFIATEKGILDDVFIRQYDIMEGYKMAVAATENQFSNELIIGKAEDFIKKIR